MARRKKPDNNSWPTSTSYEQFLYLLIEAERLVDRTPVPWSPAEADAIRSRLMRIIDKLAQISTAPR